MPFCKNCHSRISKFDKDICPICGVKEPLDGADSDTLDITTSIQNETEVKKQSSPRKKKTLLLLFCLVGFSGAPFFYLKDEKKAYWSIAINLALIAAITLILTFIIPLFAVFSFLIALAVSYLINIIIGLVYFFLPSVKDKEGVYLS